MACWIVIIYFICVFLCKHFLCLCWSTASVFQNCLLYWYVFFYILLTKPDSVYILDLIKVKRQTITLQWSISASLESHFKSHKCMCYLTLVLGTCKSHLRCFTHYFHFFLFLLLLLLRLRQLYILVWKTAFLKKLELMKLTIQVIYSATRWQVHILTATETHQIWRIVCKICGVWSFPTDTCQVLINSRDAPIASRLATCSKPSTCYVRTSCL